LRSRSKFEIPTFRYISTPEAGAGSTLINQVHDEILFEIAVEKALQYVPIIEKVMNDIAEQFLMPYGVHAECSPAVGETWLKEMPNNADGKTMTLDEVVAEVQAKMAANAAISSGQGHVDVDARAAGGLVLNDQQRDRQQRRQPSCRVSFYSYSIHRFTEQADRRYDRQNAQPTAPIRAPAAPSRPRRSARTCGADARNRRDVADPAIELAPDGA
jgi:hypothetical protein